MNPRPLITEDIAADAPQLSFASLFKKGAYLRLLGIQLLFGISYSSFLLLPKFIRLEFSASASQIGWVAGAGILSAAVLAPFMGYAARRFGKRNLAFCGILLECTAALLFALVNEVGPAMYCLRIMQGLAFTLVFHATLSSTAAIAPQYLMSRAIGYLGLAMLLTNAIAPLLVEPIAEVYGFRITFICAGILCAVALLFVSRLPTRQTEQARQPQKTAAQPQLEYAVYLGSCAMGAGLGVMFTFTQPFALGQGARTVGSFFVGYVAAAILVRIFASGLSDRIGPHRISAASFALYAGVVFWTTQLTPGLLLYLGIGLGVSHGFLYPALTAAGLGAISPHRRENFMAFFATSFNSGFACAVLSLGSVADSFGYPRVFIIAGTGLTIAGIVLSAQSLAPAVLKLWRRSVHTN